MLVKIVTGRVKLGGRRGGSLEEDLQQRAAHDEHCRNASAITQFMSR